MSPLSMELKRTKEAVTPIVDAIVRPESFYRLVGGQTSFMTRKLHRLIQILGIGGLVALCSGCGQFEARPLEGIEAHVPQDFHFVGDKRPCYLELADREKALRVNCFQIDGVLHIHSSRWANLPRFSGESWRDTIRRLPGVRIEIDGNIYLMAAKAIDDEDLRVEILKERGYLYAWDGITIFSFVER